MGLASTARRPRSTAAALNFGQRSSVARSAAWTRDLSSKASMQGPSPVSIWSCSRSISISPAPSTANSLWVAWTIRRRASSRFPAAKRRSPSSCSVWRTSLADIGIGTSPPGSLPTRSIGLFHRFHEALGDPELAQLLHVRLGLVLGLEDTAVHRPPGPEVPLLIVEQVGVLDPLAPDQPQPLLGPRAVVEAAQDHRLELLWEGRGGGRDSGLRGRAGLGRGRRTGGGEAEDGPGHQAENGGNSRHRRPRPRPAGVVHSARRYPGPD